MHQFRCREEEDIGIYRFEGKVAVYLTHARLLPA